MKALRNKTWKKIPSDFYHLVFLLFFLKDFIYLLLETGEGREEERERNINVQEIHESVAPCTSPVGFLARNPGMCHDWESNQ